MYRATPSISFSLPSLRSLLPLLAALLATPLAAGCYETPQPACAFYCGADNACPDGYRCAGDGWCKRMDVDEGFACGVVLADAAPVDATLVDADTDQDALPPADASPVDAVPADASLLDAGPADADAGASPDASPDDSILDAAPDANSATLR